MSQQVTTGSGDSLLSAGMPDGAQGDKGLEPEINLPKHRLVSLNLVTQVPGEACQFWIGLAANGKQSPARLLDVGEVSAMLTVAATEGVNEPGPLMLSDASAAPVRSIFLMPVPADDFRERAQWIRDLTSALKAWSPQTLGLYIAPEAMATAKGLELLLAVLRETVQSINASAYYLLTGGHGINAVLNAALRLKAELDGEALNLYIYH